MQYLGGKSKIRKQVAAYLESVRKPGQVYFEPFCGGAWVLQEMSDPRVAADGNTALVNMYRAIQCGWVPPDFVSERQYQDVKKKSDPSDPLTAFCAFGCSFAGKWWGGYARSDGKTCYAKTSKNSLLKQAPMIKNVDFREGLFDSFSPSGQLVYWSIVIPHTRTLLFTGLFLVSIMQNFGALCWSGQRIILWSYPNTPRPPILSVSPSLDRKWE